MKIIPVLFVLVLLIFRPAVVSAQCTAVDCTASLPAWGGVCDTILAEGRVNQPYTYVISFAATTGCIDAGVLDLWYKGLSAKMLKMHSFAVTRLPAGVSFNPSQEEFTAPSNGCALVEGTPTEGGIFKSTIEFMAKIKAWPFSGSCAGIVTVNKDNIAIKASLMFTVLPDARFTVADSVCCLNSSPVTLISTGTQGGQFKGPGVEGNLFYPNLAGPGVHQIRYVVSAQQGEAFAPAVDSTEMTVSVLPFATYYADLDHDGYGNPDDAIESCSVPADRVSNGFDCDDTRADRHPGASDIPGNGIDEDCNGADSIRMEREQTMIPGLSVYPSRASGDLVVEHQWSDREGRLIICSASGNTLLERQLSEPRMVFKVSHFDQGVYFVVVQHQGLRMVKKLTLP